jgi:hypothetical protein
VSGINDDKYDDKLKNYLKPVLDVQYVLGDGLDKKYIRDDSQLAALAELYYISESLSKEGKSSYLKIELDKNGIKYAQITKDFIDLANSVKKSGINKNLTPLSIKVPLSKIDDIADESISEDTLDERLNIELCTRVKTYVGTRESFYESTAISTKYRMTFVSPNKTLEFKMFSN